MFKHSFFYRYLSPHKGQLSFNILLGTLASFFNMLLLFGIMPFLSLLFGQTELVDKPEHFSFSSASMLEYLKYFISQSILTNGKQNTLIIVVLSIGGIYFFKNLFTYLCVYFFIPIRNQVLADLRIDLYERLLILPISFLHGNKKGDVIARLTSDIQEIENNTLSQVQQIIIDSLLFLVMFFALFFLSVQLTLFLLLVLPVTLFFTSKISRKLRKTATHLQQKNADILVLTEESISGLKLIKSFNAIDYSIRKFEAESAQYESIRNKVNRRSDLGSPVSEFLGTIAILLVLIFGGNLILKGDGSMAPEAFITYILLLTQILAPIKNLTNAFFKIRQGKASVKRVKEVLYADEKIIEIEHPIEKKQFEHHIRFENVGFSYDLEPVLKNLNLTIEKGKYIAIVGHSGAGKSTILDLIPRFYDATEGEIFIDDIPIKKLKISDLRSLSAIVSQDTVLFNDSIFNNIAHGKKVSKEEVIAAAKIALAHDFIMETENGYDTIIGDLGMNLSGGQRQRLSIARAVLKNAPILILDEATSALDTQSELLVQDAISQLSKNRTTIAVAHRLSTIRHADEIIVMHHGEIMERGTHDELMKLQGYYYKLTQ